MRSTKKATPYTLSVAMVLLTAAAFLLDLVMPLGVAAYVAYSVVIVLSLWFSRRWATLTAAGCCTVLVLVGLHVSPAGCCDVLRTTPIFLASIVV